MDFKQAVDFYKTQTALAAVLGVTPGLVSQWKSAKKIPEMYQWKIQGLTGGELVVDDHFTTTKTANNKAA